MISIAEFFFMELYGKLLKETTSLDHLRELFYSLAKYIPISRMPPTSRVFHYHMLRVHLQVNTWHNLRRVLKEEEYGFQKRWQWAILSQTDHNTF